MDQNSLKRPRNLEDAGGANLDNRPRSRQRSHPRELHHHRNASTGTVYGIGIGIEGRTEIPGSGPTPQLSPFTHNHDICALPNLVINRQSPPRSLHHTFQAQKRPRSAGFLSPHEHDYCKPEGSTSSPGSEYSRGVTPDSELANSYANPCQREAAPFLGNEAPNDWKTDNGGDTAMLLDSVPEIRYPIELVSLDDPTKLDTQEEMQIDEICYGMISAHAQLLPPEHSDAPGPSSGGTFLDSIEGQTAPRGISISLWEPGCYVLMSSTEKPIAVVDSSTTEILEELSRQFASLRFQAHFSPTSGDSGYITTNDENIFAITLNIYGHCSIVDDVGKALSLMKVYLQQPTLVDSGVRYDNPHYFKPQGQTTPWIAITDQCEHNGNENETSTEQLLTNLLECQLMRADGLREVECDSRITTTLFRHQKEALDFISQRESGITRDEISLWRLVGEDVPRFHNLIDGCQQSDPPEGARGGIIADEMGLGKTLTMISAIAASLDQALQFSQLAMATMENDIKSSTTLCTRGKRNVQSTLIIVPLTLLSQWMEQVQMHTITGSVSVYQYHGQRKIDPEILGGYDIILTTYAKVSSSFGKSCSPLYMHNWFRIILDEAHEIRNKNTKQFRAICALSSQRRWCLTGTPIQNDINDIAALFQYLQVYPVSTSTLFKRHIIGPLKVNDPTSDVAIGMRNLRLLLTTYCLRRKQSIVPQLMEQQPTEIVRTPDFTQDEHRAYEILKQECSSACRTAVSSVGRSLLSISVFQSIMRLRLFCNHGAPTAEIIDLDDSMCTYCGVQVDLFLGLGTSSDRISPACGHLVCVSCSPDFVGSGCPICPKPSQMNGLEPKSANDFFEHPAPGMNTLSLPVGLNRVEKRYPTKINALLEDIQNGPRNEKSIVFSSWIRSLKLVENAFKSQRIGYVLIDGRLNLEERQTQLRKYHDDSHVQVLLMTTGIGAAGLNLTIASRVHLLEPQWNPMVEVQAIGRVARLGQTRPVTVYRYIMTATIEENIQMRQTKKRTLAETTMGVADKARPAMENWNTKAQAEILAQLIHGHDLSGR